MAEFHLLYRLILTVFSLFNQIQTSVPGLHLLCNKVLLVLQASQVNLVLLGLRGLLESPLPPLLEQEIVAIAWRTFSAICKVSLEKTTNKQMKVTFGQ